MDHCARVDHRLPSLLHSLRRFFENRTFCLRTPLKRGWLGAKLSCLSAKAAACRETRGGCFKRGKVGWRERVLGSGEMAKKNEKVVQV